MDARGVGLRNGVGERRAAVRGGSPGDVSEVFVREWDAVQRGEPAPLGCGGRGEALVRSCGRRSGLLGGDGDERPQVSAFRDPVEEVLGHLAR